MAENDQVDIPSGDPYVSGGDTPGLKIYHPENEREALGSLANITNVKGGLPTGGYVPEEARGLGGLAALAPSAPPAAPPAPPTAQSAFTAQPSQNKSYLNQINALQEEIKGQLNTNQVPWFQLASAFLNPGRTGSFGEALGAAAGEMGKYQAQQQAQRLPLMQASLKAEEIKKGVQDTQNIQDLMSKLYEPTKDESGNTFYKFNPDVAQQLTKATGDPKFVSMINEETNRQNIMGLKSNLFKMPDGSTGINPIAFQKLYAADSKEALETVKSMPELRRFGILPSIGAEGTPFDALSMVLDGPFKAQALQLADRYKKGLIKDEDADKQANQLLTAYTSHQDRQSAQATTQAFHAATESIARQNQLDRQQAQQDKRDEKLRSNEANKMQTINTADSVIDTIEQVRNHPGRMNGLSSYDPRQVIPGSKEYDYLQLLSQLKSQAFLSNVQNMRGLGSLSDAEGKKITDALGSLNIGMSKEQADNVFNNIVNQMKKSKEIANTKYSTGSPSSEKTVDFSSLPQKAK